MLYILYQWNITTVCRQHCLYQESFPSFSCEYLFLPWRKYSNMQQITCQSWGERLYKPLRHIYLSLYGAWLSHSRMKKCALNEALTIMYGVRRAVCVASDQKQFNKGKFNGGLKPCYFSSGSRVLIDPISAALLIFVARGHVICTYQSRNKFHLPDKILQLQIRHF